MKHRLKFLIGMTSMILIFIAGIEADAQEIKKKGWAKTFYSAEENIVVAYAFNLSIRHTVSESLSINVDFRVPGRKVIAPETVRMSFDSKYSKRRFSNDQSLTTYIGGNKVELISTRYVITGEVEDGVFESVDFIIPYATFAELVKEKNIKMLLGAEEFELPGWVKGQLKNVIGMVEN